MALTFKQRVIRTFSPAMLPTIKLYWRIVQPTTYGVKVICEHRGSFLLVRNAYGKKRWTFPGGSIEKREEPADAAKRELKEETGLETRSVERVEKVVSRSEGKKDSVYIFHVRADTKEVETNEFEIAEARWFAPYEFPELGPTANHIWETFKKHQT